MLMSRHMTSQIDIAMIHAFVDHQFPQLEFSSQKLVERQKDQIAQLIDLADERFSRLEMVGGAA